jgi:hypothetical protein
MSDDRHDFYKALRVYPESDYEALAARLAEAETLLRGALAEMEAAGWAEGVFFGPDPQIDAKVRAFLTTDSAAERPIDVKGCSAVTEYVAAGDSADEDQWPAPENPVYATDAGDNDYD